MIGSEAVRIVKPAKLPVTLDELAAHSRLGDMPDWAGQSALLLRLLAAATDAVENYTGMGFITQTWEQSFPRFGRGLVLSRRPLQPEIASSPGDPPVTVTYLDAADAEQPLDPGTYRVVGTGGVKLPAVLRQRGGASWPATLADSAAIRVSYRVGFGDDPEDVPELIRHAIIMTAATMYEYREDVLVGSVAHELPTASKALLHDFRPLVLA